MEKEIVILISNVLSQQKNNPVIQKQRIRVCSVCVQACVCAVCKGVFVRFGGSVPECVRQKKHFFFFFFFHCSQSSCELWWVNYNNQDRKANKSNNNIKFIRNTNNEVKQNLSQMSLEKTTEGDLFIKSWSIFFFFFPLIYLQHPVSILISVDSFQRTAGYRNSCSRNKVVIEQSNQRGGHCVLLNTLWSVLFLFSTSACLLLLMKGGERGERGFVGTNNHSNK